LQASAISVLLAELGNSRERWRVQAMKKRFDFSKNLEAPPGFELGMQVLQI